MTEAPSTIRKAALLVRSLDAESAAVLLAHLSPEEARAVRQAIQELGEIDPEEQAELRDALRNRESHRQPLDLKSGVELAIENLAVEDPTAAIPLPQHLPQPAPEAGAALPFAWLDGTDLPTLATVLEREHLSTVAIVLSHLPSDRASQVLSALPAGRRAAALERLADLGESDRESLEVIERGLADWIASQKAERQRRADRLCAVQAILRHSPADMCTAVLSEIATHDKQLLAEIGDVHPLNSKSFRPAAPPRPVGGQAASLAQSPRTSVVATTQKVADPPSVSPAPRKPQPAPAPPSQQFHFAQLMELNQMELAELFRHCDGQNLVLALAGASEDVTHHVESLLPRSVARELRRRMHRLSAVRLSDLSEAQQQIARTAGRLFPNKQTPVAA